MAWQEEKAQNLEHEIKKVSKQSAPLNNLNKDASERATSTLISKARSDPSSQYSALYDRYSTLNSQETIHKDHHIAHSIQSSIQPISTQQRSKHIIDLTEDDDDDDWKPRKISWSSSDSSDGPITGTGGRTRRPIKNAPRIPDSSIGTSDHHKRLAKSPPAYPFLSHPTSRNPNPSISQPLWSPSPKIAPEESRKQPPPDSPFRVWQPSSQPHPPSQAHISQPIHNALSLQPAPSKSSYSVSQRPPNPVQYASVVSIQQKSQQKSRSTGTEPTNEEIQQRQNFLKNLSSVPKVTFVNAIDNTSPPITFQFIPASILRPGVDRAPDDVMIGCSCRKKRGNNECKYPNECSCLKDSGGNSIKKRSQYSEGTKRGCLVKQALQSRYNIYECNSRCDCSDLCKNRVVQWGRQVGLEIFKTNDGRGWGLRCRQDLQEGQFLDTYRGEIITTDEADKRKKGADEDNYLFDFDKFEEPKYVCDGMHYGGPTRFMNHSCRPNCVLFTVTYNHYDSYLYELAFFAKEIIPKGTELTFDYLDRDDLGKITKEDALEMERKKGYAPSICRCGSEDCRGYFFFSKD